MKNSTAHCSVLLKILCTLAKQQTTLFEASTNAKQSIFGYLRFPTEFLASRLTYLPALDWCIIYFY